MDNLAYLEVGEVARVGSHVVMCVLDDVINTCDRCCFHNVKLPDGLPYCHLVHCGAVCRFDSRGVHFIEVKSINANVLFNSSTCLVNKRFVL